MAAVFRVDMLSARAALLGSGRASTRMALECSFQGLYCFHPELPCSSPRTSCSLRGQLWAGGTEEGKARALLQGRLGRGSVLEAHSVD